MRTLFLLLFLCSHAFGAFSFNGSTQYFATTSSPATAVPITMACWFYSADVTSTYTLMALQSSTTGTDKFTLEAAGAVASDPVRALSSNATATTSAGYSATTWTHACAVFTSSTSRAAFVNGGSKGTNATSDTPSGIDRVLLACEGKDSSVPVAPFSGRLAECAIWNVALTDDEVASLAKGFKPTKIRPQSLIFYAPLLRSATDAARGLTLTNNGTATVIEHPRRYGMTDLLMRGLAWISTPLFPPK